jgi:hypothetical protein
LQEISMSPSHIPPESDAARDKSGRRRFGRAQDDHINDPYKLPAKPHEPSFCTQCGAVHAHGRWQWSPRPEGAQPSLCQACHRTNDRFPAGVITLTGPIVGTHKDEIIQLLRHQEQAEKADHPLNRIMEIDDKVADRLEISTTDIHLPRRIADAMKHAYKGDATEHFDEGGYFVRIKWHREW